MKIQLLQENLAKGLSIVSHTVSSKAQLPILSNILMTTDKGRLKLSATNLETSINYWLGAKIEEKGNTAIPAKALTEFVSSLPAGKIQLQTKENELKIISGPYQAKFVGLPASEFPSLPILTAKPNLIINNLVASVPQVTFATAQDETRPALAGVLLKILAKELILVATDGYRLSKKKIMEVKENQKTKELVKGLIIPSWTLNEITRIMGEKEMTGKIGLNINQKLNQVIFSADEVEMASRLIEGNFPDFKKVIPESSETKLMVEKETLLRAIKIASIFARESANIIKLEITTGKSSQLKISANTAQIGSNISKIEAKIEGKANKIAFNSRYLLDFLNNVQSKQIIFEMSTGLNPGIFRPVDDDTFLHIIMPVRVQE